MNEASCLYCNELQGNLSPDHTLAECRDKLMARVKKLKLNLQAANDDCVAANKDRKDMVLQLSAARNALFNEAKGVACGDTCEGGGYRSCYGCDAKVKEALGLRPNQSIHDFKKDTLSRNCECGGLKLDPSGKTHKSWCDEGPRHR